MWFKSFLCLCKIHFNSFLVTSEHIPPTTLSPRLHVIQIFPVVDGCSQNQKAFPLSNDPWKEKLRLQARWYIWWSLLLRYHTERFWWCLSGNPMNAGLWSGPLRRGLPPCRGCHGGRGHDWNLPSFHCDIMGTLPHLRLFNPKFIIHLLFSCFTFEATFYFWKKKKTTDFLHFFFTKCVLK